MCLADTVNGAMGHLSLFAHWLQNGGCVCFSIRPARDADRLSSRHGAEGRENCHEEEEKRGGDVMIPSDMALRVGEFNRVLPETSEYRVLCWLRPV